MSSNKPQGKMPDKFADYVNVAERIEQFCRDFPKGRINTYIVDHDLERGFILMRAEVFREKGDTLPDGTGHAFEFRDAGYVQKTSYIEVCETSAVGRAIAMLGYEIKRGIASREEMQKTERMQQPYPQAVKPSPQPVIEAPVITPASIRELAKTKNIDIDARLLKQGKPTLDQAPQDSLLKIYTWVQQASAVVATEPQEAAQPQRSVTQQKIRMFWDSLGQKNALFSTTQNCVLHFNQYLNNKQLEFNGEVFSELDIPDGLGNGYANHLADLYAKAQERQDDPLM